MKRKRSGSFSVCARARVHRRSFRWDFFRGKISLAFRFFRILRYWTNRFLTWFIFLHVVNLEIIFIFYALTLIYNDFYVCLNSLILSKSFLRTHTHAYINVSNLFASLRPTSYENLSKINVSVILSGMFVVIW